MSSVRSISLFGAVAIAILLAFLLQGSRAVVHADLLPYDYPASGTEILCFINGIEDVHGVPVIRPPTPTFNVGTCGSTPPPPPPPAPACSNGLDDDGDERIDFPADPGCTSATDSDETNEQAPPSYQCSNGSDDDNDGLIDSADPGCHSDFDAGNSSSYTPSGDNEDAGAPPAPAPQCSDTLDNDGDGRVDTQDPGCSGAVDNDETDPTPGNGGSDTGSGGGNNGNSSSANSGGSSGGGGGSSGGGVGLPPGTILYTSTSTGSGLVGQVLGATAFATTTDSCDRYLTAFIREGKTNDADQVKRLQRFLKNFEGAPVEENGTYDKPTLAAVYVFQTKYAADILTPWGIKESTGYVYLTTRKKVNEIFCGYTKTFFLTVDEQRKIDDARATGMVQQPIPSASKPKPTTTPSKAGTRPQTPSSASTTPKGQSGLEKTLQFLQRIFNR